MRLKHYLLILGAAICLVGAGAIISYVYMGKSLSELLALQQEESLVEWNQLAYQAYSSGSPETGIWVLKKYLAKIDSIYSLKPGKDRRYYFISFVAHARLAKLYKRTNCSDCEAAEIVLAAKLSNGWSNEINTNETLVFGSLKMIDEIDSKTPNNQ